MPILDLSDLLLVTTQQDALALELTLCSDLGLPTSAWQALSPEMAILGTNSQLVSSYSININQIAAGGYVTLAATIAGSAPLVDAAGFSTVWMDLVSVNVYNVTRIQATFATGSFQVQNTSGIPYTFVVGQLHFQNPVSGATYSNTASGTIPGSTSSFSIAAQADAGYPGSSGTFPAGDIPILLTPLSGVAPLVAAVSLVGSDIELNSALVVRCQNKLGSLSPNGASQAYEFVATSIPTPAIQASAPVPFNHYSVTAPITRVATLAVNGVVDVYLANAAGAPSSPDIASVNSAIQAICVPLSVTATVAAVGTVPLNLVYTVYVPSSLGLSSAQVTGNINLAIQNYCAGVPIGGVTGAIPNIVPYDELVTVIMSANPGTNDLVLTNPSGDLSIGTTSVPVPGTPTPAVVFV